MRRKIWKIIQDRKKNGWGICTDTPVRNKLERNKTKLVKERSKEREDLNEEDYHKNT